MPAEGLRRRELDLAGADLPRSLVVAVEAGGCRAVFLPVAEIDDGPVFFFVGRAVRGEALDGDTESPGAGDFAVGRRLTFADVAAFLVDLVPVALWIWAGESVFEPVKFDLVVRFLASAVARGTDSVASTGVRPPDEDFDLTWPGERRGVGRETASVVADLGATRLDAIAVTSDISKRSEAEHTVVESHNLSKWPWESNIPIGYHRFPMRGSGHRLRGIASRFEPMVPVSDHGWPWSLGIHEQAWTFPNGDADFSPKLAAVVATPGCAAQRNRL
jgi:hypothetical protein